MLRRKFLKISTVAAAWLLLPNGAKAAETSSPYTGPLWIFVHAGGGWDPTSLCDPKGSDIMAPNMTPMNKTFSSSQIRTAAGSTIPYAPLAGDNSRNDYTYSFQTFFDTYGQDLLVINGIDAQTNGHSTGTRYAWSGNLSQQIPAMGALFAGTLMPDSPLSFITFGGYDYTGGLVPATRLNNASVVDRLAYPNLNGTTPYYSDASYGRINQSKNDRAQLLAGSQILASTRNALNEFTKAHTSSSKIKDFQAILDTTVAVPGETSMRRNSRIAMASFRAGLSVSVSLTSGGFDTHSNHDLNHTNNLARLLKGVDEVMQEAQTQGISDRVTVVIGSEFGRTRGYNSNTPEGKDHWPVTSMMFMGAGIRGGRVIGATTDHHVVRGINPTNLQIDDIDGINITPAHINKALRKLAGIDDNLLVTQNFPINVEDIDLFS